MTVSRTLEVALDDARDRVARLQELFDEQALLDEHDEWTDEQQAQADDIAESARDLGVAV